MLLYPLNNCPANERLFSEDNLHLGVDPVIHFESDVMKQRMPGLCRKEDIFSKQKAYFGETRCDVSGPDSPL